MSDLNDPRVLFAAERTLLAWSRTSLTLMGFGFLIERFGLFIKMLSITSTPYAHRGMSFWVGIVFIVLGVGAALLANLQYRRVLSHLRPAGIPQGYLVHVGMILNFALAVMGASLVAYLIYGFI
jgi:putative membrane protein